MRRASRRSSRSSWTRATSTRERTRAGTASPTRHFLAEDVPLGPEGLQDLPRLRRQDLHLVEEETYFFRLSAYQEPLLDFYADHPEFVRPPEPDERGHELRPPGGLKDLSITRTTVKWGIPVPGDPKHTIYVWFDALHNYLTGIGYGSERGAVPESSGRPTIHLMAKDILRFHAIFWPAFLMAGGFPLPGTRLQPRLVAQGQRQDVQVQGQRPRPEHHPQDVRRPTASAISSSARSRSASTATSPTRRSSTG